MLQLNILSPPSPLTRRNPKLCSANAYVASFSSLGSSSSISPMAAGLSFSASSHLSGTTTTALSPSPSSSSNNNNKSSNKLSLTCLHQEYSEPQSQRFNPRTPNDSSFAHFPPGGGPRVTPPGGSQPSQPRVFAGHTIYKGKAALTVEPRSPEFVSLDSGAIKVSKEGFVLLQFAPAIALRQYDWTRKQVFSLSVTEIGTLISLGARESFEFLHDPYKGKSEEGTIRKVLRVEPLPDGSGHFFNLSVQNKSSNMDESIYIPVSKAERAVLVSALNFILPHLLGWHAFASSIKPDDDSLSNFATPRPRMEREWNR